MLLVCQENLVTWFGIVYDPTVLVSVSKFSNHWLGKVLCEKLSRIPRETFKISRKEQKSVITQLCNSSWKLDVPSNFRLQVVILLRIDALLNFHFSVRKAQFNFWKAREIWISDPDSVGCDNYFLRGGVICYGTRTHVSGTGRRYSARNFCGSKLTWSQLAGCPLEPAFPGARTVRAPSNKSLIVSRSIGINCVFGNLKGDRVTVLS